MPVCKNCGQYYVREPCPTCGYTASATVSQAPTPQVENKMISTETPVPKTHESHAYEHVESMAPKSEALPKPGREEPVRQKQIETGINPLEIENRKLRTELEIAKRELQGYKENVKEAITKIERIFRELER